MNRKYKVQGLIRSGLIGVQEVEVSEILDIWSRCHDLELDVPKQIKAFFKSLNFDPETERDRRVAEINKEVFITIDIPEGLYFWTTDNPEKGIDIDLDGLGRLPHPVERLRIYEDCEDED